MMNVFKTSTDWKIVYRNTCDYWQQRGEKEWERFAKEDVTYRMARDENIPARDARQYLMAIMPESIAGSQKI